MKEKLKQLLEQNQWNITEEVIKEALEYHSQKHFLKIYLDMVVNLEW